MLAVVESKRTTIQKPPGDSEEILYPDTYYPSRPFELDNTNLYTFMSWYDVVSKQRSEGTTYLGSLSLKTTTAISA